MSKRVVLHIGLPHTGADRVQRWCDLNRRELAAGGVGYPALACPEPFSAPPEGGSAHHRALLAECLRNLPAGWPGESARRADSWRNLLDTFSRSPLETLLVSDEEFGLHAQNNLKWAVLSGLLADFRLTILVCFRRLDLWIEEQYLRHRALHPEDRRSITELLGDGWNKISALSVLRPFQRTFPTADIVVRSYEALPTDATLVADGLQALGLPLDPTGLPTPREAASAGSITLEQLALLDALRQTGEPDDLLAEVRDAMLARNEAGGFAFAAAAGPERRTPFPRELVQRLRDRYREDLQFLNETCGTAFEIEPAGSAEPLRPITRLGPAGYREVIGSLASLLEPEQIRRLLASVERFTRPAAAPSGAAA